MKNGTLEARYEELTEEFGISAPERLDLAHLREEQCDNFFLRAAVMPRRFAHVDSLGGGGGEVQQCRVDEAVINYAFATR